MVTLRTVDAVDPVENADNLEVARVGGWNVVVRRGDFSAGETAVFFEIDSFLREDLPAFADFQARGQKSFLIDGKEVRGHVLKTAKLRGVVSQGLLMKPEALGIYPDVYDGSEDLSSVVGVVKYDVEKPKAGDTIGSFDTRFAPKTDAERVQNLADHWEEIKSLPWEASVKVDGMSQTVFYDSEEDRVRIFSRNWEVKQTTKGFAVAEEAGILDFCRENPEVVVQFELAGTGINGNRQAIGGHRAFVFAVYADGVKIPKFKWDERLRAASAPLVDIPLDGSVEDVIEAVSGIRGHITKDKLDEGVVFHLTGDENLPVWMDRNANFKVISQKYLVKNKL